MYSSGRRKKVGADDIKLPGERKKTRRVRKKKSRTLERTPFAFKGRWKR